MSSMDFETVCNHIDTRFKKEWMDRPDEIKAIENLIGAKGFNFSVHFWCMAYAKEILEYIWHLRGGIQSGRLPLESGASFLGDGLCEMGVTMDRYYKAEGLADILNQAGTVLHQGLSMEEVTRLTDLLLLYLGRYVAWLDADLDWYNLSLTHEKSRKNKP